MATKKKVAGKKSVAPKKAPKVVKQTKADKAAWRAKARKAIGGSKRSQRKKASDYVNFDQMGRFTGYKKGAPKGYVYLPGSRYLSKTSNLRLVEPYASAEQRKFVRGNRKAVNAAIERASREGAFRDYGMNRMVNGNYIADFDLSKGGKKFADKMKDYFHGQHSGMRTRRFLRVAGHPGRRQRAQWSFAFGQDGHVK